MTPAKSILLVEANPVARLGLAEILREEDYSVVAVRNATEGIAAARRQAPQFAIIDTRLPDRDGLSLMQALRISAPSCLFVFTCASAVLRSDGTSHWFEDDSSEAMKAGAIAYLSKPLDVGRLVTILSEYTGRAAPGRDG